MNLRKVWLVPTLIVAFFVMPAWAMAVDVEEELEVYSNRGEHGSGGFVKGSWVHQEMYMLLLIEKYAPETTTDWAPVLAEKKRLTEEMRAFYEANPERAKKEWKALKKQKGEQKEARLEQMRASHQRFSEAVQSRDEQAIQAALKEQLENCKVRNEEMASRLAELKKK